MTIAYVTSPFTTAPTYNKAKFKPHDRQKLRIMKVTTSNDLNAIEKANQAVNVAYIPAQHMVIGGQFEITTKADDVDGLLTMKLGGNKLCSTGDPNVAAVLPITDNTGIVNDAGNVSIVGNAAIVNCVVSNIYIAYIELDGSLDAGN